MTIPHTGRDFGTIDQPADRPVALDDFLLDPEDDDDLERCLFEIRASHADFRNL